MCFLTIPLKESCKIGHNQDEQETESRKPNDWVKSWLSKQTKIIVQISDPGSFNLHLRDLVTLYDVYDAAGRRWPGQGVCWVCCYMPAGRWGSVMLHTRTA